MPSRKSALASAALVIAAACATTGPADRAAAQSLHDASAQQERAEVRAVEFHGVHAVKLGELRQSLATQPSSCLSPFKYVGLCALTKSPYFYERRYFDHEEFRRDVVRVLVFYYRRGWRDATVDTTVSTDDDGNVRVRFDVVEGPPTVVDTVVVAGLEGVFQRRGRRRAATPGGARARLRPGDPLNLLRLDTNVVRLREVLLDRGHGNATVDQPAIAVDTAEHRARVTITAHPGPLTPIARIDVVHLRPNHVVSDETIRNSLTIEPGQLLRRSRVGESQRALYESGLFRSALIDTAVATDASNGRTVCAQQGSGSPARQAPAAVAAGGTTRDSTKNLVICVLEGQLRNARISAGFTTADFFSVQGRFTDNYWLAGPRRLDVTAAVGNLGAQQLTNRPPFVDLFKNIPSGQQDARYFAPTYQAGVDVRQRWFRSPRNTIGGGIFFHRRSSPGVFVDRGYGANMAFTRNLTAKAPLSATYRFEISEVDAGEIYFCVNFGVCDFATIDALQGQQRLSPAAITGSFSTADDPLEPKQGSVGRVELEHAATYTLSDYHYSRANLEGSRYFRLPFRRAVLAVHAEAGWVAAARGTNKAVGVTSGEAVLHPSKRFYAGGSQSVRGYGENQLGPRVLTLSPDLIRGREEKDGVVTYQCGGPSPFIDAAAIQACYAQRSDSLADRDYVERPLGGTTLASGSVELRVPLWGPIIGAAFVDGAILGERSLGDFGKGAGAITPGIGVRYLSPVGPVRVDMGFRPKLQELLPVFTQITATDSTTRLVDLTAGKGCSASNQAGCRRFPLRESDKVITRLLDRITLHLSIGEAF